jgi:hypothetical protein
MKLPRRDATQAYRCASLALTDYSQFDRLDLRYKFVNLGTKKKRARQIGKPNYTGNLVSLN